MQGERLDNGLLTKFEAEYKPSHARIALEQQRSFLAKFPLEGLKNVTVDEYVVGRGGPSFCNYVSAMTVEWASIQAGTALRFGMYFGYVKGEVTPRYHCSSKFGTNGMEASRSVKAALLDLIERGGRESPNFNAIDDNPLSQTFKAKIISLYFPTRFLAVCSSEHLEKLAQTFGFPGNRPSSQYQNLLLQLRNDHPVTQNWSNPKFMAFLYQSYGKSMGWKNRHTQA